MLTDLPDYDDHEMVCWCRDAAAGLTAVIAIHNTRLGPAHGGTRAWHFATEEAAVTDALRLSRGMTLKNALAGLPLGGGKSVILPPEGARPTPAMLHAFGRAVETLSGRYIPAEDVGIGPADMAEIARTTSHAFGVPSDGQSGSADPSPFTALGVCLSIGAVLERVTGRADLAERRVAIQGLGGVGWNLCRLLAGRGARLVVADIDTARAERAAREFAAEITAPEAIHRVTADVFAPCALGAVLNDRSIPELGAPVVCGAANNQLADAAAGAALMARGVLYAPDFVVNAGGVMWTSRPATGWSEDEVRQRIAGIPGRLAAIFEAAERSGITPEAAAERQALEVIARGRAADSAA